VAADLGVLSLALRSVGGTEPDPDDRTVTKTWDVEATQIALAAHAPPPAGGAPTSQPPPPRAYVVEVVRGAADSQVALPQSPPQSPRGQ
jgi:hypothetical protein